MQLGYTVRVHGGGQEAGGYIVRVHDKGEDSGVARAGWPGWVGV